MAILPILTFPHKILKQKAEPIDKITDEIVKLAIDMLETMYEAPGMGLAAPQVGISKRLIVEDVSRKTDEEGGDTLVTYPKSKEEILNHPTCHVFINPIILEFSQEKIEYEEGCLSLPGFTEKVKRPNKIKLEATLVNGERKIMEVEGVLAVCIQHEIDHLDGKLFIDRIGFLKRSMIQKKILKEQSNKEASA